MLTDTGTDAVKVVRLFDTTIGTDTIDTLEGTLDAALVSVVDPDPEASELVEPPGESVETETGKGGIMGAVVDVPEDCPVLDDPWI